MAANLAKAECGVRGFDLVPLLRDNAAKEGVSITTSAKEALEGADVVITMLPGGKHVLSVWTDLLPHAHKGMLFIDSSTIDIGSARRAHELAGNAGVLSVDAPVSGGTAGAKAGTLTFMCGAEEGAFAAAKPVLEKMGRKIIHCGEGGAGQAAKICNNMLLGVTMIATAEAFVLAEKLGLSHQALFDVASTSSGQSWSLTSYCPVPGLVPASPANSGYKPGFTAALMLKDLKARAGSRGQYRRRDAAWCCGGATLRSLQRLGRGRRRFLRHHQDDPRQERRLTEFNAARKGCKKSHMGKHVASRDCNAVGRFKS